MNKPLQFHWSLSQAGNTFRRAGSLEKLTGVPPYEAQIALCRRAEQGGIDSVLMAIGFTRPDPLMLTVALGMETSKLSFMVACRPGLVSPVAFVQQVNTVSQLLGGRIHVNLVCGHSKKELAFYGDHLDHDQRYQRSGEFLAVCNALWSGSRELDYQGRFYRIEKEQANLCFRTPSRRPPAIYLGGNSRQAARLVIEHGHCLWRFPDRPAVVAREIAPILAAGKAAGLLVSLIARPTREEAHRAAAQLVARFGEKEQRVHCDFASRSDSVGFTTMYRNASNKETAWVTDVLWNGAVPYLGAPAIALVGSYDDIAGSLIDYKSKGISEFLFMGWPEIEELEIFASHVLPQVRAMESSAELAATGGDR